MKTGVPHHRSVRTRIALAVVALAVLAWALVPLARAVTLVRCGTAEPQERAFSVGAPHDDVAFAATDGVSLRGTYFPNGGARTAIVLVHGFKNTRDDMIGYAAFLLDAGYAVLVYDSRGCGASGGTFGVGATEDRDIRGAVTLLKARGVSRVGVLGVSLGAGDAILAAARDERIDAVVADSSWADESAQLDRMSRLAVGAVNVPLLPYEPALVDALVGGRLEDARPRDEVVRIAPRPLLLIHSADDANATTPLSGARQLLAAAGDPKELWIAPSGGHAGAFGAQRDEYQRRVVAFFRVALG